MKIEVIGVGCPKCLKMYETAKVAATRIGADAEVVKVFDLDEIARYGVAVFPALAVDGKLLSSGKMLDADAIVDLVNRS